MQESLEKRSKQVNEINWDFKILSGTLVPHTMLVRVLTLYGYKMMIKEG